jgi:long-subunit fatty acid transport protein
MKKSILLSIMAMCFFVFLTQETQAQVQMDSLTTVNNKDSTLKNRLKFGLGFGVNFIGGTNLSLSPNLTYRLTKNFSVGGGLQFNYAGLKDIQKTTTYGANALVYYTPVRKLLTTLEFSELHVNRNSLITNTTNEFWESALFIGAGIQITPKLSLGAKYNVLYDKNKSVYSSPVVPFINISF